MHGTFIWHELMTPDPAAAKAFYGPLLGWEPKHSLCDALSKMVAALKTEPLAWYQANKLEPPSWLEETVPRQKQEKSHAS